MSVYSRIQAQEKNFTKNGVGWFIGLVKSNLLAKFVAAPNAKAPYAGRHLLSLKCNPERIIELRNEFPEDILPGYYSDGRTWISIDLESDVPDGLVLDLCDKSYALVFSKLTKKVKDSILTEF